MGWSGSIQKLDTVLNPVHWRGDSFTAVLRSLQDIVLINISTVSYKLLRTWGVGHETKSKRCQHSPWYGISSVCVVGFPKSTRFEKDRWHGFAKKIWVSLTCRGADKRRGCSVSENLPARYNLATFSYSPSALKIMVTMHDFTGNPSLIKITFTRLEFFAEGIFSLLPFRA